MFKMKRNKLIHHLFYTIIFWSVVIVFGIPTYSCKSPSNEDNISDEHPMDSLDYYTNWIATHPLAENENVYLKRASLFYKKNAYDAALRDLKTALTIDSTRLQTYLLKSQVEMDYFRSLESLRTLQTAETIWPESILVKERLAKTHLILKQYDKARLKTREVLVLNPLAAQPYLILGMIEKENQDTIAAIKHLQTAVQNDADLLDAWIEIARLQMRMNPEKAAPYFESALQIAPEDLKIWHAYAMFWEERDSLDRAKQTYESMLQLDSMYLDAYYNQALILMDQDSFQQAIPLWHQFILRTNDPAKGYYYRGICSEMDQNYTSALVDYQMARELNPDLAEIDKAIVSMQDKLN